MSRRSRLLALILFTLTALSGSGLLRAEPCPRLVWQWGYGPVHQVAPGTNLVYFASGSVLMVARTDDQGRAQVIAETSLPEAPNDLLVEDDLLLVAAGASGLLLFDVSDPSQPAQVAAVSNAGSALALAISDGLACVLFGPPAGDKLTTGFTMLVVDISSPHQPEVSGSYTGESRATVLATGYGNAYIGVDGGLLVVDLSDPTNPTRAGSYYPPVSYESSEVIVLHGDYVYLQAVKDGKTAGSKWGDTGILYVIDISNRHRPVQGTSVTYWVTAAVAADSCLYVSDSGLEVIDISRPTRSLGFGAPLGMEQIQASDLAISDGRLYAAAGRDGLMVIDLEHPDSLTWPGANYQLTGWPNRAVSTAAHLYIAGSNSLDVVDISNPAEPQLVSSYSTPGGFVAASLLGDLLAANSREAVHIYDVTRGDSPVELAVIPTDTVSYEVVLYDDNAYIADESIRVVSLQEPASPQEVTSLAVEAKQLAIDPERSSLLVGHRQGIKVFDISDPGQPIEVSELSFEWSPSEMVVFDSHLYTGTSTDLRIFDISDPAALRMIAHVEEVEASSIAVTNQGRSVILHKTVLDTTNPERPMLVEVHDPMIAYTEQLSLLWTYGEPYYDGYVLQANDFTNPTMVAPLGSLRAPQPTVSLAVASEQLLLLQDDGLKRGLRMIDLTTPESPVTTYFRLSQAEDIEVAGDLAYTVGYAGMQIFPVSQPSLPLSSLPEADGRAVAIAGGYAYVAGWQQLHIVDISKPSAPLKVAEVELEHSGIEVVARDSAVYVTNHSDDSEALLTIIDVTSPSDPIVAATMSVHEPQAMAVSASHLYMAGLDGLQVIDIESRYSPDLVFSGLTEPIRDMALAGEMLLGASALASGELLMIDVREPSYPIKTSIGTTPGTPNQVVVANGNAYVADGMAGVSTFDLADCGQIPPIADFSWWPDRPKPGQLLQLNDCSSELVTSWLWDLGDGTTSAEQSPIHSFAPGTWIVTLTVGNGAGTSTATKSITVLESPRRIRRREGQP